MVIKVIGLEEYVMEGGRKRRREVWGLRCGLILEVVWSLRSGIYEDWEWIMKFGLVEVIGDFEKGNGDRMVGKKC